MLGKGNGGLYNGKPLQWKKEESERLRGEIRSSLLILENSDRGGITVIKAI